MLSYLADLESLWGPLRLFRYISLRAMGGAATAMMTGMLIAPYVIARLRALKAGQVFRTREEVGRLADLHNSKKDTPTMGGLIVFFSVVVSTILWARLNIYVVTALVVFSGLTVIGFIDDFLIIRRKSSKGLSGKVKLAGQGLLTVVALALLLSSPESADFIRQLWLPFYKEPIIDFMPLPVLAVFLYFVLSGSSNAINLTDGVDGLAIGCTVTVAMAYALMSYASGNAIYADYLLVPFMPGTGELTIVLSILCGASLAFLWHNAHPAAVFMGDTGSLALGGLIGIVAFMILQPITLIIIGGVFVMEVMSVILQVGSFKTRKKRIFLLSPIHHHFELKGWAETQVVIRFWILSLVFAVIGLATLKLR
ncbi:MAG: phospho-N-acetylmuramoyl-pentapeptide-transferase [Opitutales bacterium]|jgi:phospho-N-acetylmuramoyl-pentapeptide-transferase